MHTFGSKWRDVQRWIELNFNFSLKYFFFFFSSHTTTSVTFHVYNKIQLPACWPVSPTMASLHWLLVRIIIHLRSYSSHLKPFMAVPWLIADVSVRCLCFLKRSLMVVLTSLAQLQGYPNLCSQGSLDLEFPTLKTFYDTILYLFLISTDHVLP